MSRGLPPIPTEGRLNLALRRTQEHTHNATLIAKLIPSEQTFKRPARHQDPADTRTLRGIPAIGRGVAGNINGTQPEHAATR